VKIRSSVVVVAIFGCAALLSGFVVYQVVKVRRAAGPDAAYLPKGPARLLDPGAGLAPPRPVPTGEVGWLSGRVAPDAGALPAGTAVLARRSGGQRTEPFRAVVNDLGAYRLELPEGEYRVWAAAPGAAEDRAQPAFARVERGRTFTLDLAAAAPAGLAILVVEPDGAPSPGAVVSLARAGDPRLALATPAAADGRVGLAKEMGLAGVPVDLQARNGGRTGRWSGTLPESGVVTVRLAPAGGVEGKVVAARGKAPAGFVVTVSSQPAPRAWRTVAEHRFTGDAFALPDLPPEPLRLSVRTDDGRRGIAEVTLAPGETRSLKIGVEAQ
jgi:hypothetical protein